METLQQATETKSVKEHKCDFCCGIIKKGEIYLRSTHKMDGDIYSWKTHEHCAELAHKLHMYDDCDEGLTTENFIENVKEEYKEIMSKTQTELYESKGFTYPPFAEQLVFVLEYHKIEIK